MSLSRSERAEVERMALGAWLDSGKSCVKELSVVPDCRDCGRVPTTYIRFDDGSVRCLDSRDCEARS